MWINIRRFVLNTSLDLDPSRLGPAIGIRFKFTVQRLLGLDLIPATNSEQWTRASTDKMMVSGPGERNKQPILEVLTDYVPSKDKSGFILEIASGGGQHISHFAQNFPHVKWQPTDIDKNYLKSIEAHIEANSLKNVLPPVALDISKPIDQNSSPELTPASCDLILNINMVHISPWEASVGLFKTAGALLKPGGILFMYGPFKVDGVLEPDSNVRFDQYLRSQDSRWGIRDLVDLDILAKDNQLKREKVVNMPANNKCTVFRKEL